MVIKGIVLAAGCSRRMGDFKLLMEIGGRTMIEHSVKSMFAGGAQEVIVVLGCRAGDIRHALQIAYPPQTTGSHLRFVSNQDYDVSDMLSSVRCGAAALGSCDAFYLLPGDMPAVGTDTYRKLQSAFTKADASVAFPLYDGKRGHPPLIASSLIPDILTFEGPSGLQTLLNRCKKLIEVPTADIGCTMDNDTKEDFETCRNYLEQKAKGGIP